MERFVEAKSRLSRAREVYREALLAQSQAEALRKPTEISGVRLKAAAQEYEAAVDEFIKQTVRDTVRRQQVDVERVPVGATQRN